MSRTWEIDLDRPLSDEDKEYLASRPGHQYLVDQNEERFSGKNGQPKEEDPGPSLKDQVQGLSEKDLNEALKSRGLPITGKKKDRQERLMEHVLENETGDEDDEDDEDDDGDDGEGENAN